MNSYTNIFVRRTHSQSVFTYFPKSMNWGTQGHLLFPPSKHQQGQFVDFHLYPPSYMNVKDTSHFLQKIDSMGTSFQHNFCYTYKHSPWRGYLKWPLHHPLSIGKPHEVWCVWELPQLIQLRGKQAKVFCRGIHVATIAALHNNRGCQFKAFVNEMH